MVLTCNSKGLTGQQILDGIQKSNEQKKNDLGNPYNWSTQIYLINMEKDLKDQIVEIIDFNEEYCDLDKILDIGCALG